MEDLIMKKLIMFVMVLVISMPALALIDDVAPPSWGNENPIATVVWQLDEDVDYYDEEGVEPSCLQGTVDSHLMTFEEDWSWENGILYCEGSGLSAVVAVPKGEGGFFTCQVTARYDGEPDITEPGIEIWHEIRETDEFEWLGEDFAELVDLGDGYYTQTATFDYSEDITHIGAVYRGTYGMMGIIVDAVLHEAEDPPVGGPRPSCTEKAPPITVDSNDMPVYEPYDPPDGPPVFGPTDGQLLISLAWQPGDPCYPEFYATVTVDPNTDGDRPHDDFIFSDSVAADGSVNLIFDANNWDIPQNVVVEAVQDLDREGDRSYRIELTVTIDISDPNFGNPTPVVVTKSVAVIDNDVPYVVAAPPTIKGQLSENDPCVPYCFDVTLSHIPNYDVYVLVDRESDYGDDVLESMSVMDPPLGVADDPNKLKFTPDNYDTPQTICLEARDDDELAEEWLEWVGGEIVLTPYSEDVRYRVDWLNADGIELDDEDSGGEAEEKFVDFNVQDNECGSVGYPPYDVNEDCHIGLSEVAALYDQWTLCTEPYPSDPCEVCDKLWNLVEE